jgi:hypothetical protein
MNGEFGVQLSYSSNNFFFFFFYFFIFLWSIIESVFLHMSPKYLMVDL